MRVRIPNGFEPRAYQIPFMRYMDTHPKGGRAVWVVHRRGGKDLTAMHQTCKMMHERVGTYWHIFPTSEQGRRSIWTEFTKDGSRIMEQVFPAAIRKSPREWAPNAEMVVELKCGSIWRLMGSDKIEVAGAGPVGVVFSEFALAKPQTWDFVRPMIREREGWAAFVSTPRGRNHFYKVWETAGREAGWWRELKTLYDTRAYDPEKTIAEERAEGMPEDLIRQEYLCDWNAANVGSYYGDLLSDLENAGATDKEFDHDTDEIVTSWDLGVDDSTSVWAWKIRHDGADLLAFHEEHGKPMSYFFDLVDAWADQLKFKFDVHFLPHDARARTLQTGESILDQCLAKWGSDHVAVVPQLGLMDGIQAARWLLQRKVRFHPRCTQGLEALKAYHRKWDEERKVFALKPEHDWSSHAADAFRYGAVMAKLTTEKQRKPPPREDLLAKALQPPTLDDLFASQPAPSGRI